MGPHLPANFHQDPTKTVEKLMFRTPAQYVYDVNKSLPFTFEGKVCNTPGIDGYSAVTSAADFGYTEILRIYRDAAVPLHWNDKNG